MYIYLPFQEQFNHRVYDAAVKQALAGFQKAEPDDMAEKAGAIYSKQTGCLTVKCYNHSFSISYPEGIVTFTGTDYYPPTSLWIIILNYLWRGDGTLPTGEYIPYHMLPSGNIFAPAFNNLAIKPIIRQFGNHPGLLLERSRLYGGEEAKDGADLTLVFNVLPAVNLKYRLWSGDEEVPPSANILFGASAAHYLHTEDLSVLGSFLTEMLVGAWKTGSF